MSPGEPLRCSAAVSLTLTFSDLIFRQEFCRRQVFRREIHRDEVFLSRICRRRRFLVVAKIFHREF